MQEKSILYRVIDEIAAIFLPIINLLTASGVLKGILAILSALSVLSSDSGTYIVLNAISDSLFYFLPLFLAVTTAERVNVDKFTALTIGCILLYPSLASFFDAGSSISFLGLDIPAVIYHSSIIPIILSVYLLSFLDRALDKIIPSLIKGFLKPAISILLVSLITLFIFGPIGSVIGDALAFLYESVYSLSPIAAGFVLSGLMQVMVIFGFHWSFIIIGMNNIALLGEDTVLAFMGPPAFAQAGASLAVFFKTKDGKFKSTCLSAMMSALFGITEPAMFGVTLPRKKPFIAVCISGAIGGALTGYAGVKAHAFAFPSLVTLPIFLGDGFALYVASSILAFLLSFILTMILKFDVDI